MLRRVSFLRLWIERTLLLAGLAALAVAAWFMLGADLWRQWENRQFDEAVSQLAKKQPDVEQPPAAKETPPQPAPPPVSGAILGRLTVPRLGMKSIVREGASDGVLSLALGHIRGTALPGEPGNIGVAGHRDTLFRGLRNIRKQDEIVLETVGKKYLYQVESTKIVEPSAVDVLHPGNSSELTLVTCYPFEYIGAAPNRFIVKARLMEEAEAPVDAALTRPVPIDAAATHASVKPRQPEPKQPEPKQPEPGARPVRAPERKSRPEPTPQEPRRVAFTVTAGHSRELVPGKIWFGVSAVDLAERRLDGWVWIAPARRTLWLRNENTASPVSFRNGGQEYELIITRTSDTAVSGYLLKMNDASKPRPLPYVASAR